MDHRPRVAAPVQACHFDVLKGSRSHWLSAYAFSGVTRGLDPRVHPLRKVRFARKMDCRVKPGNDAGDPVAARPASVRAANIRFSFVRVRSGVNVPSTLLNRADEVIE